MNRSILTRIERAAAVKAKAVEARAEAEQVALELRDTTHTEILRLMAEEGLSLNKACEKVGMKRPTFLLHASNDEALADRYARAREELLFFWADEIIDLADACATTEQVAVARLQTDNRKWILARLLPDKYGDRGATATAKLEQENPAGLVRFTLHLDTGGNEDAL